MNGVVERRNRILKNTIRSMICYYILPESFSKETFKIATYIFNRVATKVTVKTPYEFWIGKKFSLKLLHI